MEILTTIVNGLSLGGIYAMIALGYTMVYGIAKMLNFAHGDIIMVGGYTILVFMNMTGHPLIAVLASVIVCILLGVVIEKVAYKPLRGASPLAVLITAIGVSYFLQSMAQIIFGSATKMVNIAEFGSIKIGSFKIQVYTLITLAATIVVMVALSCFIKFTKTGRAMIAVSEDSGAAQLMGINVNSTISLTFAIGSGLAAVASILLCSTYPQISPYTGAMPGIKAFTAAVFGGIGSIPGAMIGGVVLGIIESLSKAYISSQLSDAIVFGVLIIVLLVKPTGLFGKPMNEKV